MPFLSRLRTQQSFVFTMAAMSSAPQAVGENLLDTLQSIDSETSAMEIQSKQILDLLTQLNDVNMEIARSDNLLIRRKTLGLSEQAAKAIKERMLVLGKRQRMIFEQLEDQLRATENLRRPPLERGKLLYLSQIIDHAGTKSTYGSQYTVAVADMEQLHRILYSRATISSMTGYLIDVPTVSYFFVAAQKVPSDQTMGTLRSIGDSSTAGAAALRALRAQYPTEDIVPLGTDANTHRSGGIYDARYGYSSGPARGHRTGTHVRPRALWDFLNKAKEALRGGNLFSLSDVHGRGFYRPEEASFAPNDPLYIPFRVMPDGSVHTSGYSWRSLERRMKRHSSYHGDDDTFVGENHTIDRDLVERLEGVTAALKRRDTAAVRHTLVRQRAVNAVLADAIHMTSRSTLKPFSPT